MLACQRCLQGFLLWVSQLREFKECQSLHKEEGKVDEYVNNNINEQLALSDWLQ